MSNLTAVSLFAGVGGFDLALTRAGVKVVAAVEIDKKCREVLALQFPETKLFDDVKGVTGEQLRAAGFVPERGIITAGFPCQDLSIAGLRKGLDGSRSGLFWEIIRIIDETHAEQIILENVVGLLSSKQGQDMGIVITALVERGYGVCWRVLDSQNFGVPQRRRRVFIVASLRNHRRPVEILFEPDSSSRYLEESGKKRKRLAAETKRSVDENSNELKNEVTSTATLLRMRGGKEGGGKGALVSEEKSLTLATGNDQTLFLFQCNRKDDHGIHLDVAPTLGCFVGSIPLAFAQRQSHSQYVMDDIASTITTNEQKQFSDLVIMNEPKAFDTYNQVVTDKNQTLSAAASDHSHIGTVWESSVVRRVTPKECERLQGFPDDWTASQPNSSRYKMMGNAVSVPVVEWIIRRMVKLISE